MENFFYGDQFCADLEELCRIFEIEDKEDLRFIREDKVQMTDLETIFIFNAQDLCDILADANEERLGEYFGVETRVVKALEECIDFEKLKEKLPKLYYTNGKYETITKADLVECFS